LLIAEHKRSAAPGHVVIENAGPRALRGQELNTSASQFAKAPFSPNFHPAKTPRQEKTEKKLMPLAQAPLGFQTFFGESQTFFLPSELNRAIL
jgi:hypothetical protein